MLTAENQHFITGRTNMNHSLGDCVETQMFRPNMYQNLFFPELCKENPLLTKDINFTHLYRLLKLECVCV